MLTILLTMMVGAHADPVFTTGDPDPATTDPVGGFTTDPGDDTIPQIMDGTTTLTDMSGGAIGLVNVEKLDDTHYTERWVVLEPSNASALMQGFRMTWSHNATWDAEFSQLQTLRGWHNKRYIRMDVAYDGPLTLAYVFAADDTVSRGARVTTYEVWYADGQPGGLTLATEPDGWMMRELTMVAGQPEIRDTYVFRDSFIAPGAPGERLDIIADGVGASSQADFLASHLGDNIANTSIVDFSVERLSAALTE